MVVVVVVGGRRRVVPVLGVLVVVDTVDTEGDLELVVVVVEGLCFVNVVDDVGMMRVVHMFGFMVDVLCIVEGEVWGGDSECA